MKNLLLILLAVVITGCAAIPTQQQIDSANYGEFRPTNFYKDMMTAYLSERLVDPYSVAYSNWRGPKKTWWNIGSGLSPKYVFGYLLCVDVNAKNRMGGYTGTKPASFLFTDNGDSLFFRGFYRHGTALQAEVYSRCIELPPL